MMKKLFEKIDEKCGKISEWMIRHHEAVTVGYFVFGLITAVVARIQYGARTKAILKGRLLRDKELYS